MPASNSIIIENRSRDYIENRIRAGLIEHWAADLLIEVGVGERMQREGMLHWGINIGINGDLHRIDFKALVDKRVTIYGQQEVVKDLVERRLADGGPLLFEVDGVSVHDMTAQRPKIRFTHAGKAQEIDCDFIAGCDGFHGVCRPSIPDGVLSVFERDYPFGWLGILSESPPPDHELIYSYTDRGFALYTMRSPTLARLYLQCGHDEDIDGLAGRPHLERTAPAAGRRAQARRRPDRAKGHHADAQLRGRADAARPTVPRRRQRAYRAADRRQRHEPGLRRRGDAVARARRVLQAQAHRLSGKLFRQPACGGSGRRSASPGG